MAGGSNPPSATNTSRTGAPLRDLAALVARGAGLLSVRRDATLVLAVSGGPDSMALLHGAASAVANGASAWHLHVAHLDHGLRPESADDARFVAGAAERLGIASTVERVAVADLARSEGRSVEEAGREARYRFFERVAPPDALIATAHTADDAVETVLLNLLRGSGLAGARGIPERRGRVIRPLLGASRAELRELLEGEGIESRDDPSNDDPAYLRNRIRHELVPLLEALRPGAVQRIGRFARLAADDDDLLDEVAGAELERRRGHDGTIDWRDPPAPALGRRVLRMAIGDPAPSAERLEALLEAAGGERGGITIELGGGRTASVREHQVCIG